MDYTDEHFYMLALSLLEGLTPYHKIKLLEEKGSAEAIFQSPSIHLKEGKYCISYLDKRSLQNAIKNADIECESMAKNDINSVFANENEFPFRLRYCPDYPLALFHRGELDANRRFAVSIVGTRKADILAERRVVELLESLSQYKKDFIIVAGIAPGVDGMVLNHAQKLGFYTACVLPHGFAHRYDFNVEKRINMASCVVTENPFKSGYGDRIYEQRNRIIVGMSDAVVVTQAKNGNGAGLYIGKAIDYNRDTFAFVYPGESPLNEKCNLFVEEAQAIALNSADDFLEKMIWPWGH